MKRLAIIGGGITGLSAAWYACREFTRLGINASCTLFEASDRLGGKIVTERTGGFVIEGGPDSFLAEKPAALELCRELGLQDEILPSNEQYRRVYILRRGRLVPFPEGFRLTIPTRWMPLLATPLLSPFGKLRMAAEVFIPPRKDPEDESLASFIRRRFGNECLERIAGPLLGGIFVSDPERLSMQATFPRLLEMERTYGSLIRAARAASAKRPQNGPLADRVNRAHRALFHSLRNGIAGIVEALERHIEAGVIRRTQVHRVIPSGRSLRVETEAGEAFLADAAILAIPANRAAEIVRESANGLAEKLERIRFVSSAVVTLAYRADAIPAARPLDGFGVLVPDAEGRAILAITWSSTKFANRAPPGAALMRVFLGGPRHEGLAWQSEEDLVQIARTEVASILGIRASPLFHRLHRWIEANPQYDVGHSTLVKAIESEGRSLTGLFFAGSSYHGVGIPDCIESAKRAVLGVLQYWRDQSDESSG